MSDIIVVRPERSAHHPGQPLQVVNVQEDHSFDISIDDLEAVLLDPRVRDNKVVILSVAGAFRKGKSFLLNFCLRYLQAEVGVFVTCMCIGVLCQLSVHFMSFSWSVPSLKIVIFLVQKLDFWTADAIPPNGGRIGGQNLTVELRPNGGR